MNDYILYNLSYMLLIPAVLLSVYAQFKVQSTFNKYAKVRAGVGMTAAQVARDLLDRNNLADVPIERIGGNLTDHYDPRSRVLRLSQSSFDSASVAALGVAAHECGHALQDAEAYGPLRFRNAMVPVANFGSSASWLLILGGLFFQWTNLIFIGILCFAAVVLFQLVTLPVEFNASSRALAVLESGGYLSGDEVRQTNKVLRAAALTYVAAALTAILQLLRLLLLFNRRRD